uniref:Uncharacterized protein n=1 Tax=Setaria digitata TaxID=48799 RepID=A0A915PP07_9BILA
MVSAERNAQQLRATRNEHNCVRPEGATHVLQRVREATESKLRSSLESSAPSSVTRFID